MTGDGLIPNDIPLLEFDADEHALINPRRPRSLAAFPDRAVITWFGELVAEQALHHEPVHHVGYEHGDHPIYVVERAGSQMALVLAPVGAPAAVGALEALIACGATKIIGCGGAGIVRSGFDVGHVIVPTGAVRDEGTSYHYVPAGVAVGPHPLALEAIGAVLGEAGIPFDHGTTWTTDGYYRETPARVARRAAQGCITVEMEASAMFAVAAFRHAVYGQLLYAGDDVSAEEWDHRDWQTQPSARVRLLELALAAAARL